MRERPRFLRGAEGINRYKATIPMKISGKEDRIRTLLWKAQRRRCNFKIESSGNGGIPELEESLRSITEQKAMLSVL